MISARFHSSRLTRAVASLCIVTQVLFPVASTAGHRVAAPQAAPAVLSEQDATAAQVAGMTTQAAGMLQSGMNSRQAAEMARGYATSTAQSAFQEWLSQWGTVRVTLGLDEDFTLKGSAFDLLLPWHDTPENLLFTQHSFHRTDDRNQLNTGAGWRHFAPDYMAGVNLFFDHDLTRYHSRMGLGGEYWRDNLKLGANGYLRLSGWRDAPELDYDYEARPANGWDVRAEGYLPAYPQLGATLMYEQYYGDEVALFGKDKRQQDPHAFTAGLSYTPVPLISLSAEQKQGKGGENDTRFALNLTYTPGVSLARQLDPDAVAYRRSLAGSRHDLVERNNNIVLEYRKKELVKLQLHDPVTGKGGEQKPLVASLQSKYALKTLRAEAAELQSAGGVVNTAANQVTVTLPEYRYTATPQTDNVYRVAVTAEDEKGNRSNREEASVVVLAPQLSAQHSQVTSDKTTLKPDGTEKAVLTFRAQDAEGKAVSALTVSTSFTAPQGMALVLSDTFTETETKGTYTAELKGTMPGEVRVMPQVAGKDAAKDAVTVTLVNTTPVSEHSSITLSPAVSRADRAGQAFRAGDAVTATVILRDEQQRPVIHQAALLTEESVTVSGMEPAAGAAWQEEDGGIYRMQYIAKNARDAHKATLRLADGSKSTGPYVIHPGEANPTKSLLGTDKPAILANGDDTATLEFIARDAYDNIVSDLTIDAVAETSQKMDITLSKHFSQEKPGTYTAVLHGTTPGDVYIMPKVGNLALAGAPVKVQLKSAGASVKESTLAVASTEYRAGDEMVVALALRDKFGNPLGSEEALQTAEKLEVQHAWPLQAWKEIGEDKYERIYQAQNTGANLQARLTISDGDISSEPYLITAGDVNAGQSALSANPTSIEANNKEMPSTLTYKAMDAWKNPVTGLTDNNSLTLKVTGLGGTEFSGFTDKGEGIYTGTLTGTQSGQASLMPQVNNVDMAPDVTSVTLTAGKAVAKNSRINVGAANFTAGTQFTVTVTLRDASENPVTGAEDLLTNETVKVPGATRKGAEWTGNGDGTYRAEWEAEQAGNGYKATLHLAGWGDEEMQSAPYNIQPGEPTEAQSHISTDGTIFTTGDAIPVTVTLKDAWGNHTPGQASYLSTHVVAAHTVPQPTQWQENSDGTYSAQFIAGEPGTGLQVTLNQDSGWKVAATYSIIAGEPAINNSFVDTDKNNYQAGNNMLISVKLADSWGNALSGREAILNDAVAVGSATRKEGSVWTEDTQHKGTYTAYYMAQHAGQDSVKLTLDDGAKSSDAYTIVAAAPVDKNSAIQRGEAATYTAGDTLKLTVTLQDNWGNPVSGMENVLEGSVTLPEAEIQESGWQQTSPGVYEANWTARIAGPSLTAKLELEGWRKETAPFAIVAAGPDYENSSLRTSNSAFTAGDDITITVILMDTNENPVTGAEGLLTNETVKVPGATRKGTVWTDKGDGTYRAEWEAEQAGNGYKATLHLAGWGDEERQSDPYNIQPGEPAEAQSGISTDGDTFVAGQFIPVTVTLKDAWGNHVPAQESYLATHVVAAHTVPQPTQWQENSDGTYSAQFIAGEPGTGLQVTLNQDSGWKVAATYSIIAGEPAINNSFVDTDKNNYQAGNNMLISVKLADSWGNALSGREAILNDAVAVGSATRKEGSVWTEDTQHKGTYTAYYMAQHAGQDSVKLTLDDGAKSSDAYTIVAAAPVVKNSAIQRGEAATYTAGDTLTLTVTLQDDWGNPVSGMENILRDSVTLPEAGLQERGWQQTPSGEYEANWTAQKAGTLLTASLELEGWRKETAPFAIVAGTPVQSESSLQTDKESYTVEDTLELTATLRDAWKNPVSGKLALVNDTVLTIDAASATDVFSEGDTAGTYIRHFTLNSWSGSTQQVSIRLQVWNSDAISNTYRLEKRRLPMTGTIVVNGSNFGLDEGFPTTGLSEVMFDLKIDNSPRPTSFLTFCNNGDRLCSWVRVEKVAFGGQVTFTGQPTTATREVTIEAHTENYIYTYTFTLNRWFVNKKVTQNWEDAKTTCNGDGSLPLIKDLTSATEPGRDGERMIGNLFGEWGSTMVIWGDIRTPVWTSEIMPNSFSDNIASEHLGNGRLLERNKNNFGDVVCRIDL